MNKFAWTEEFKKTWDETTETEGRQFVSYKAEYSPYLRIILRELIVVVDVSESIEKDDFLPTIRSHVARDLVEFNTCFIRSNPISTIQYITFNNKLVKQERNYSTTMLDSYGKGSFSLIKCINTILKEPNHNNMAKEALIITASLGTVDDATEIASSLEELTKQRIKISIISLCGDVTFFRRVSDMTGGRFIVPCNTRQFKEILKTFVTPSEALDSRYSLVEIGFPDVLMHKHLCICHLELMDFVCICPRCNSPVCRIPVQCPICSLRLVSPLDICTSMVANFPTEPFVKIESALCRVCNNKAELACSKCTSPFCDICDHRIHVGTNFCPFCPEK